MPRIVQGLKPRGSQRWLQVIANREIGLFERVISDAGISGIEWLSPIESDGYKEYRDQAFLDLLNLEPQHRNLKSFWPPGGPRWDGLARSSSGAVILIEAKANIRELKSPASRANPVSAALIDRSMNEAKPAFGAPSSANWTTTYYQYANRLAYLYFLRACNQIDAYLVFLYFTGAFDVRGPSECREWQQSIRAAHEALQIGQGTLTPFVVERFIDVTHLAET